MPIQRYGVLKGKALEGKVAGKPGKKPHYQIHIRAAGVEHRIAVNVMSDQPPSELRFYLDEDFHHDLLAGLPALAEGYQAIPSHSGGLALDFVRNRVFDPADLRVVPLNVPGPSNDLAEIFGLHVQRAIDRGADVYAFGAKWGPETDKKDDYFGFLPGNGIHDIHMNQGSPPPHKGDNGIWQDGGLLIHFPAENRWLGFFLVFQSQSFATDERGDIAPGVTPVLPDVVGPVVIPATTGLDSLRIVAALVNPPGDDVSHETVTLLNPTPGVVDLNGWKLVDGNGKTLALTGPVLGVGEALRITLTGQNVQLGNKGGTLNLRNPAGIIVHGVTWTEAQAGKQGWTLLF
jgi:uncharacterized protein YukJ